MSLLSTSRVVWFLNLCYLLLWLRPSVAWGSRTDSLLQVLDQTLNQQHIYDQQRLDRLAKLKTALRESRADKAASFSAALLICDEY